MFWRHQGGLIKGLCLTGSLLWGLTGWAAATAGSQLKSRDFFKAPLELMKIRKRYKNKN